MWTRLAIAAAAGAIGAALVNRNVAVYHDGLRPLLLERSEGRLPDARALSASTGLNVGLAAGFGLPFSLISTVILAHALWAGTDIIGVRFPGRLPGNRNWAGLALATVAGALYGAGLCLLIEGVAWLLAWFPIPATAALPSFGAPILFTFAAFPAAAIAYQYGLTSGLAAFALTLAGRLVAGQLGADKPDLWALAVGFAVLVVFTVHQCLAQPTGAATPAPFPSERFRTIRRNLPALAVLGAVYGLACNQAVLMEGPQTLVALALGERATAAGFSVARAICFLPVKTVSAITSGVFAMDGLGFVATAGLVAPSPVSAAVAGAVVMCAEALSVGAIVSALFRFPVLSKTVDNIRTGMSKMLELGSLAGGAMAAHQMASGLGLLLVGGLFALNEAAGTPISRVAVGPAGFVLVAVVVNVLALLGVAQPLTGV